MLSLYSLVQPTVYVNMVGYLIDVDLDIDLTLSIFPQSSGEMGPSQGVGSGRKVNN